MNQQDKDYIKNELRSFKININTTIFFLLIILGIITGIIYNSSYYNITERITFDGNVKEISNVRDWKCEDDIIALPEIFSNKVTFLSCSRLINKDNLLECSGYGKSCIITRRLQR